MDGLDQGIRAHCGPPMGDSCAPGVEWGKQRPILVDAAPVCRVAASLSPPEVPLDSIAMETVDDTPSEAVFGFQNIVGDGPLLRAAVALAERVAATRRTTVLLVGETGTGKELFARGIHYAG